MRTPPRITRASTISWALLSGEGMASAPVQKVVLTVAAPAVADEEAIELP